MATNREKAAAKSALDNAAAPGPHWSNNNSACTNTWFCLTQDILGQLPKAASDDFDVAGDVKMSQLKFWNKDGGANREVEAKALADMLTKLFVNMIGAKYEAGNNYASAVLAMTAILTDAPKTVAHLAAVVDEQHHFLTEG